MEAVALLPHISAQPAGTTSNHNQPGVHKNTLEGHMTACRTPLIKTICSQPHVSFISKSLLSHMDLVIDSVI